jgi:hypothetical protein
MKEEFKAPETWLPKFKEIAGREGDEYYLTCYRTSPWQVEVNLMKSSLCIAASWKINARTGKKERTL